MTITKEEIRKNCTFDELADKFLALKVENQELTSDIHKLGHEVADLHNELAALQSRPLAEHPLIKDFADVFEKEKFQYGFRLMRFGDDWFASILRKPEMVWSPPISGNGSATPELALSALLAQAEDEN